MTIPSIPLSSTPLEIPLKKWEDLKNFENQLVAYRIDQCYQNKDQNCSPLVYGYIQSIRRNSPYKIDRCNQNCSPLVYGYIQSIRRNSPYKIDRCICPALSEGRCTTADLDDSVLPQSMRKVSCDEVKKIAFQVQQDRAFFVGLTNSEIVQILHRELEVCGSKFSNFENTN